MAKCLNLRNILSWIPFRSDLDPNFSSFLREREDPNITKSGSSSARQRNIFKGHFAGPTLNAGLVVLIIPGDLVQYCQEIIYFCDFSGGVRTPCPPPSGSAHGTGQCIYLLRYTENPFYHAHRLLYNTLHTFYRMHIFFNWRNIRSWIPFGSDLDPNRFCKCK